MNCNLSDTVEYRGKGSCVMAEKRRTCWLEAFGVGYGIWREGGRIEGEGGRIEDDEGEDRGRGREDRWRAVRSPYVPQQGGGCSGFVGRLPPAMMRSWTLFHGFNTERTPAPEQNGWGCGCWWKMMMVLTDDGDIFSFGF